MPSGLNEPISWTPRLHAGPLPPSPKDPHGTLSCAAEPRGCTTHTNRRTLKSTNSLEANSQVTPTNRSRRAPSPYGNLRLLASRRQTLHALYISSSLMARLPVVRPHHPASPGGASLFSHPTNLNLTPISMAQSSRTPRIPTFLERRPPPTIQEKCPLSSGQCVGLRPIPWPPRTPSKSAPTVTMPWTTPLACSRPRTGDSSPTETYSTVRPTHWRHFSPEGSTSPSAK